MFRLSRKERRMLRRLGLPSGFNVQPLEGVVNVSIEFEDKILKLENAEVTVVEVGGQKIFQVIPGSIQEIEKERETPQELELNPADIQLVASQAGVSLEEAEKALRKCNGDLAKAILFLQSRKRL
ncbi:hypothetical protein DRO02_03585 [archaeon]|nr:MAG: hypothetical protein DRO21_03615 [archaeon]RLG64796.1 MAG: hypothetical protein DRO02_03585 [archaeon]